MIFVIVPLGKEASHIANWVWRVVMYTAGTTVGAALLAAAARCRQLVAAACGMRWPLIAALGPPLAFYAFHVYTEVPSALAIAGPLTAGYDVGRRRNASELIVLEQVGTRMDEALAAVRLLRRADSA